MVFDDRKYTEDSAIKQLSLIELHSKDGSALDAGCGCIEGKHLFALEGLSEEGVGFAMSQKEKDFYAKMGEFARKARKSIEESSFEFPHNPVKLGPEYYMEHPIEMPEVVKRKLRWGERIKENPGPRRRYEPYGWTQCEKAHPNVKAKMRRCIKKVEQREGCVGIPYTECPVNPVAVCRASIKCP